MNIRLRAGARSDLAEIFAHSVAAFGEEVAWRYKAEIDAAFARLAGYAKIGSIVAARPHLRSYPVGEHRVYYAITKEEILIVRVLHKAMDATTRL